MGGRQAGLALAGGPVGKGGAAEIRIERPYREPRVHMPSDAELAAHAEMVGKIKNAIWAEE